MFLHQQDLQNDYNVPLDQILLVGSINAGERMLLGPIVALLVNKYGFKWCTLFGSLLCIMALAGCMIVREFWLFQLLYGFVLGVGACFLYVPANNCSTFFFKKREGLAFGIVTVGANFGFILAIFYSMINGRFNIEGVFVFNAVLCLALVPLILIFYPTRSEVENRILQLKPEKDKKGISALAKDDGQVGKFSEQLQVLLKFDVWSHLISCFFGQGAGHMTLLLFIPKVATDTLNVTSYLGGFLLTILGIAGIPARLLVGFMADHEWANPLSFHCLGFIGSVICSIVYPLAQTYWQMASVAVFQAFVWALYASTFSGCSLKLSKIHQFNFMSGLALAFTGFGSIVGPPMIGYLYDNLLKQDMFTAMVINGLVYGVGTIFAFFTLAFRRLKRRDYVQF